jgi:malonyl-CoA O-methyltransferase
MFKKMAIKNQVIAGFNRGATTYDQAAGLQARIAENLADKLQEMTAANILEIGCGTGLLSSHLIKKFPHANFLFTDISPAMLQQCRQLSLDVGNAEFACLDGEALDALPKFNLITSSMTFHWFKNVIGSLQKLQQQLVKGGRLHFSMLTENSLQEWRAMCIELKNPISTPYFPKITELKSNLPNIKLTVESIRENYQNARMFLNTLKSLGATAPRTDYTPLAVDKMRKMLRHFDHEIEITYEVVYGEYCHL